MILHDYSLITEFETKYLASSCIYITFKIIEQVCEGFRTKEYVDILKQTLSLKEQIFYNSSELILNLAKNFERVFSFAKNLMKFDSFSLDKKNQYRADQNGRYQLHVVTSKRSKDPRAQEQKKRLKHVGNENSLQPKNNKLNQLEIIKNKKDNSKSMNRISKENDDRTSKLGYIMGDQNKNTYYKSFGKRNSLKFGKKGH